WNPGSLPHDTLPYLDAQQYADRFAGGQSNRWGGGQVLWVVPSPAGGVADEVLVRGHQLDGDHALRFNGGVAQRDYQVYPMGAPLLDELRLEASLFSSPPPNEPGAIWFTETRLQAPGYYAYQVDGLTFHEVVIFQAVVASG